MKRFSATRVCPGLVFEKGDEQTNIRIQEWLTTQDLVARKNHYVGEYLVFKNSLPPTF